MFPGGALVDGHNFLLANGTEVLTARDSICDTLICHYVSLPGVSGIAPTRLSGETSDAYAWR